jgi:hypothetical protein
VNRKPRRFTLSQLADALDLDPVARARFERAAATAAIDAGSEDNLPHGRFLGAIPDDALVAREDEMARIGAILDFVTEGSGHLLLVSGRQGSGKTRLLQELTVGARARGYVVLTGACYSTDHFTPCRPVLETLSELPAKVPVGSRSEAERRQKAIRPLVERAAAAGSEVPAGTPAHQHIASVFADLLLHAAGAVPVALVIDDLQWADEESLRVLHHLARVTRSSRILLAGAFCDHHLAEEHPLFSKVLHVLTHDRLAECLAVRRLSPEETTRLMGNLMGRDAVSEEFSAFVYRRTKGNPRLIEAMVWSLGGRLELQGEIGAGSTGRVFRAFDRRTDMIVAAKLVLAREGIEVEDLLRFQQEGKVLASLDHPNIVRVYDTFAEEHAACIIMELLDGQSLAEILEQGPMPLPRVKTIGLQTAEALGYAHSQSIVHRDIKPDNVMVLANDRVKVTDFGIARILRTDSSLATMVTTGMRAGTPSYMSPEQISGRETDGRADVYALGAMLFHMVAGRPPFEGSDKLSIAVKHLQDEPVAPSSINHVIPADWDALILKSLQKEPSRRFRTAGEMHAAIEALSEVPGKKAHWRAHDWRILAGAGAFLAALAVMALLVLHVAPASHAASIRGRIDTYVSALAAQHRFSGTILVGTRDKVVLDAGYGMADRRTKTPASASTEYPVPGVTDILSITALLRTIHFLGSSFPSATPICRDLPTCTRSWRPITVGMLLDGTANLPHTDNMGTVGNRPAQSLISCESKALDGSPGSKVDYENCGDLAMGMILQKFHGNAWARVLGGGSSGIFGQAGMPNTGQMTDALASAAGFARGYDGAPPIQGPVFNDNIQAYSTASDVYALDKALFGGKLLSRGDTTTILAPHGSFPSTGCCALANPGIARPQWGYEWKTGLLFGRRVYYTFRGDSGFQTVNMRFRRSGLTVVVLSNDFSNDALGIAMNAAALASGREPLRVPGHPPPPPPSLLGTYRRTFGIADLRRTGEPKPSMANWVGGPLLIQIERRSIAFGGEGNPIGPPGEYYTATPDGRMTLLGFTPTNGDSMCTDVPTETPPSGHYRWRRQGKTLTITLAAPDPCSDRRGMIPGQWRKIG